MIYYFIPDPRIYGGVKVGYQFVQLLNDLRIPAVVASPRGTAPRWFSSTVSVLDEEEALDRLTARDQIIFSLPYDYERLKKTPARLIFHCQGTNPMHDPTFRDPETVILTCWEQATRYVWDNYGRKTIEIGIAISDCFYRASPVTFHGMVSYMPRRGRQTVMACMSKAPGLLYQPIEGLGEEEVAALMQQSEYYLATAEEEWFGLPALEAMAAGCIVLSVPVLGGMEYLHNGINCMVTAPEAMPDTLLWLASPERAALRERIRYRAIQTAYKYRLTVQRRRLAELLNTGLKGLFA